MRCACLPCVCARGAGESEVAWEVVGGKATVGLLPKLPSSLRLHVYGPLDVLLAMANMLPKASGVAMQGHRGRGRTDGVGACYTRTRWHVLFAHTPST